MNIQFAVKKEDGRPERLRARSQSARQPHGAVCLQGHRHAAWPKWRPRSWPACRWPSRVIDYDPIPSHVSVKESVFPFVKFAGVDIVLGPEMRSTGEVMGVSDRFSIAFAKSQLAAGRCAAARRARSFISVAAPAKEHMVVLAGRQ